MTTLRVNPIACDAHGLCVELLPELIRLDDWGYPIIDESTVPPELVGLARMAADACPDHCPIDRLIDEKGLIYRPFPSQSRRFRELLIDRVHHPAHEWLGRYRAEGHDVLLDRSSAPATVANRTDERRVEVIAALRRLRLTGLEIAECLQMAHSTVSGILRVTGKRLQESPTMAPSTAQPSTRSPAAPSASSTCAPAPTGHRPTAESSDSSEPIAADHTAPSATSPHSPDETS